MSNYQLTKEMMQNLEYDRNESMKLSPDANDNNEQESTAMVVFHQSDLNAAAYNLAKSMKNPFSSKAIISIFVQESCENNFKHKTISNMKMHSAEVTRNKKFLQALDVIKKLNPNCIRIPDVDETKSPVLVCDFTHDYFGGQQSGVVTFHTFRTTKEAITLVKREKLITFKNISIWCENHARAYELVASLVSINFYINCNDIPLSPIEAYIRAKRSVAVMENSYHFESILFSNGIQKNVIFPFGTIFAN